MSACIFLQNIFYWRLSVLGVMDSNVSPHRDEDDSVHDSVLDSETQVSFVVVSESKFGDTPDWNSTPSIFCYSTAASI